VLASENIGEFVGWDAMAQQTTTPGLPTPHRRDDSLPARLERLRQARGVTYRALTADVNRTLTAMGRPAVSRATLARWFRDEGEPRLWEAAALAQSLGVPLPALVDPDHDPMLLPAAGAPWDRPAPWQAQVVSMAQVLGRHETLRRLLLAGRDGVIGHGTVSTLAAAD